MERHTEKHPYSCLEAMRGACITKDRRQSVGRSTIGGCSQPASGVPLFELVYFASVRWTEAVRINIARFQIMSEIVALKLPRQIMKWDEETSTREYR